MQKKSKSQKICNYFNSLLSLGIVTDSHLEIKNTQKKKAELETEKTNNEQTVYVQQHCMPLFLHWFRS